MSGNVLTYRPPSPTPELIEELSPTIAIANPANVHGLFTIGITVSKWNCQQFTYDLIDAI